MNQESSRRATPLRRADSVRRAARAVRERARLRAPGAEALEQRTLFAAVTNLAIDTTHVAPTPGGFADIWSPLARVVAPRGAETAIRADAFRHFKLDAADLRQTLRRAPMEFTPAAS